VKVSDKLGNGKEREVERGNGKEREVDMNREVCDLQG
jgi:hypothetical protein